jgi:hypothetical protein
MPFEVILNCRLMRDLINKVLPEGRLTVGEGYCERLTLDRGHSCSPAILGTVTIPLHKSA